jgi:hypothetical protein
LGWRYVPEIMTSQDKRQLIRDLFRAIESRSDDEARNLETMSQFFHSEAILVWPPALPYGGVHRLADWESPSWTETWNALQPTAEERRMDPQFLGVLESGEVAVRYRQRGKSGSGRRLDTEVLGIYEIRDERVYRAQMYYFEEACTARFLADAGVAATAPKSRE